MCVRVCTRGFCRGDAIYNFRLHRITHNTALCARPLTTQGVLIRQAAAAAAEKARVASHHTHTSTSFIPLLKLRVRANCPYTRYIYMFNPSRRACVLGLLLLLLYYIPRERLCGVKTAFPILLYIYLYLYIYIILSLGVRRVHRT